MEKQKILINYKNSGVKTLNGFSFVFLIVGGVMVLNSLFQYFKYTSNDIDLDVPFYVSLFYIPISYFAISALLKVLSVMAKTSLYKRAVLEEEFDFEDITPKSTFDDIRSAFSKPQSDKYDTKPQE
jgi:hypothetical protein